MARNDRIARGDSWAVVAAALPQQARAEHERPFWQALARSFGWRKVVDAGCGGGFHLRLLRELAVDAVGFDAALEALAGRSVAEVVCADILRAPFADGTFDATLCLGNTISLLPSRSLQRDGLSALMRLVRPGGLVLLQGEDTGALVVGGPVVRARSLNEAAVHVRVFERVGRRVRMLAGVVAGATDAPLQATWLLPTSAETVARLARSLGLVVVPLPVPPPTSSAGWWAAFSVPSLGP
jgi:SAM-dependent methyltransferase